MIMTVFVFNQNIKYKKKKKLIEEKEERNSLDNVSVSLYYYYYIIIIYLFSKQMKMTLIWRGVIFPDDSCSAAG